VRIEVNARLQRAHDRIETNHLQATRCPGYNPPLAQGQRLPSGPLSPEPTGGAREPMGAARASKVGRRVQLWQASSVRIKPPENFTAQLMRRRALCHRAFALPSPLKFRVLTP
jgi:hypothetical protein